MKLIRICVKDETPTDQRNSLDGFANVAYEYVCMSRPMAGVKALGWVSRAWLGGVVVGSSRQDNQRLPHGPVCGWRR